MHINSEDHLNCHRCVLHLQRCATAACEQERCTCPALMTAAARVGVRRQLRRLPLRMPQLSRCGSSAHIAAITLP